VIQQIKSYKIIGEMQAVLRGEYVPSASNNLPFPSDFSYGNAGQIRQARVDGIDSVESSIFVLWNQSSALDLVEFR